MKVEEFIKQVKEDMEKDSHEFILNMNAPPFENKDRTFCEWMPIFIAWMDYGSSCERYYRHRE